MPAIAEATVADGATGSDVSSGGGNQAGSSLVEIVIAAGVLLVVLSMTFTSMLVSNKDAVDAIRKGTTTDEAMTVLDALQPVLAGAVDPINLPSGITSDCSGNASGTQSFPTGQGPFVSTTSTDVALCTLPQGKTTAYTDEINFANDCNGPQCTVTVTQWPAYGSNGAATTVFTQNDVSDGSSPQVPLVYDGWSGSSWTTTSTLANIEAVQLSVTVPSSGGNGTTIERLVLLPNTLSASGSANT